MDYPRCKTCRWWEQVHTRDGATFNSCSHPVSGGYVRFGKVSDPMEVDEVYPDFGCVHHEPKEGG